MSDVSTAAPAASTASAPEPLVDRCGRVHRSLRVSVTDACNLRCQYCMPASGAQFLPQHKLLSFAEIESVVRVASQCGLQHIRLTGGEPLLRPNLEQLVEGLRGIETVTDLALTTNGMLLPGQLDKLVAAGLQRINISLDTLSADVFKTLARRDGLQRVLEGIEATQHYPQLKVKLNALVLRDVNLDDVFELIDFSLSRGLQLRFIEFMPLDSDRQWSADRMVPGDELRTLIADRLGPLQPLPADDPSQPAVDYQLGDHAGRLGFIDAVSHPFCGACDRLRLTADGKIRNCLFGSEEWDLASVLRESPLDPAKIQAVLRDSVRAKYPAHGIAAPDFQPPHRAMYQIGG